VIRRKKSATGGTEASRSAIDLQRENEELRRQLDQVIATASANEIIWRHFAEIERILFRTREVDQLVEELLREIKHRFMPDQVILLLCQPDLLERFFPDISEVSEPIGENTWILRLPAEAGGALCGNSPRPFLFSSENIQDLLGYLPQSCSSIKSGVLLPLRIHQVLFGGLFLGSIDADRYRPKDGTDLLEQLGMKIAICLDNCLTYERVKDFAIQDSLTGLFNFFQIHSVLEREFRKARRLGTPLSVLLIDLSFFHELEGHFDVGNEVLRHAADLLKGILPQNDTALGRYGSDEFLVILPGVSEEEAREVVPYLSKTIRKSPFRHQNAAILIQTVIGVGTLSDDMKRPQDLLDSTYSDLCRLKVVDRAPSG
jgi:diguanylate cyclase (GGDEF)-like protein